MTVALSDNYFDVTMVPSVKYYIVNWDDEIPKIWKHKIHVPNQQPVLSSSKIVRAQQKVARRRTGTAIHHQVFNLHCSFSWINDCDPGM